MDKNCNTCTGKFTGCMLENCIKTNDIELDAECLLEKGIFEEILKEQIDLENLFEYMQKIKVIKKNINIDELSQDDDIMILITETVSNAIWNAFRIQARQLKPKFKIKKDYDFSCSLWR